MIDHGNAPTWSCDGKRRYPTWTEAVRVARNQRHRDRSRNGLIPYVCNWCGGVHLASVDAVYRRHRVSAELEKAERE